MEMMIGLVEWIGVIDGGHNYAKIKEEEKR